MSTPTSSDRIAVNGVELYYEIHGEGDPLVMLHGGVNPSDMFGAPLARIDDGPLLLDLAERQARLRRSEVQLRRISQQIARFDTLDQRAFVSPTDLDDLQTERELDQRAPDLGQEHVHALDLLQHH